ncbi:TPA: type II toxin-antitoxin system PemK/MazF family toxin, partial [bacterium]|nr:type II toxin-antitoxin system PemK/MazF family toxin [bacterium]
LIQFPFITDTSKKKERPVVVIQNDFGNRFGSNIIVAAISSQIPSRKYPFHFWVQVGSADADGTGIQRDSIVHAEIIMTVPKTSVIRHLGRFNETAMKAIDECIKISLALT